MHVIVSNVRDASISMNYFTVRFSWLMVYFVYSGKPTAHMIYFEKGCLLETTCLLARNVYHKTDHFRMKWKFIGLFMIPLILAKINMIRILEKI